MIDLSEVVNDPELGARLLELRRVVQTVDGRGRAVNTETPYPFTGCITMDKAAILERIADGEYITGSILVTTMTQISEGDIIVWNGKRYGAMTVSDYLWHGVNWIVGVPDGVGGAG